MLLCQEFTKRADTLLPVRCNTAAKLTDFQWIMHLALNSMPRQEDPKAALEMLHKAFVACTGDTRRRTSESYRISFLYKM